mmetsp:Transcript_77580/g.209743  ORF Transcript_77580/g.209743 Transcript_77580/m.209743 type:complete len:242 (+) Transcript_77580:86-811(+)
MAVKPRRHMGQVFTGLAAPPAAASARNASAQEPHTARCPSPVSECMKACVRRRSMHTMHWSSAATAGAAASSPPQSRTTRRAFATKLPGPRRFTLCCTRRSSPNVISYFPGGRAQSASSSAPWSASSNAHFGCWPSSHVASALTCSSSGSRVHRGAPPSRDWRAHTSQTGLRCSPPSDIRSSRGSLCTLAPFEVLASGTAFGEATRRSEMGTCDGRAACSREATTPADSTTTFDWPVPRSR